MTSLRSPGASVEPDVVRAAGRPAVGDRAGRGAPFHDHGPVKAAVRPEEGLTLRVEAGQRLGAGEIGEMVAALAVLGLVVDDAPLDLDLADVVIALEVGGVVLRVPQAELDRREDRQIDGFFAVVGEPEPPDLEVRAQRDKIQRLSADAAITRRDGRVRQPVAALVGGEVALGRLPGGRPELAAKPCRAGICNARRRRMGALL